MVATIQGAVCETFPGIRLEGTRWESEEIWKGRARMAREDGVFTLKLDEGVSLAMLVSFAQDMLPR